MVVCTLARLPSHVHSHILTLALSYLSSPARQALTLTLFKADMVTGVMLLDHAALIVKPSHCVLHPTGASRWRLVGLLVG